MNTPQIKENVLTRRIIGWLLLGMTPLVLVAIWLVSSITTAQDQDLRRVSQMAAQHNLEMLDRLLFERYADVQTLADLPMLRKDPPQIAARLDNFATNYAPYYALLMVLDRQGRIEAVNRFDATGHPIPSSALIGRFVGKEPWFERALQAGPSVSVEDVHPDPLLGQMYGEPHLAVGLSAPVRDDTGTVIRVVSSRILLTTIAESLVLTGHDYRMLKQSPVSLVLVTQQGMELAKTLLPGIPIRIPPELTKHVPPQEPLASVPSSGYSTYPGLGWRMLAYPPPGRTGYPELVWGAALLTLLVVGATGLITWRLYCTVLQPITTIHESLPLLARRERVDLGPLRERDDELGAVARTLEQTAQAVHEYVHCLERLQTIGQELQRVQMLELSVVDQEAFFRQVLNHAVELTGARYGVLGVFDETGEQLSQFLTVGLDEATRAAIGAPSTGKGLLGFLAQHDHPVRVKDLMAHPAAVGFPLHHPPMHSFLGTSIKVGSRLYGRLYLTEKIGAEEFSDVDVTAVSILALQVGLALESGGYITALGATRDRIRRLLESTLNTAIDGFLRVDSHGRLLDVNEIYCQMTGYSREELLTMRITDLEAVEGPEEVARHIVRVIKVGSDRFETLHRTKDGRFIDLDVSVTHLLSEAGHFICFLRDITMRKAMDRQIEQLQRMATIGQLLGGVAHELKNPLFILTGRLHMLRDKLAQREYGAVEADLDKVEAASQRMTAIVQRFFAFARPHQSVLTRCSVTSVIKDTLAFLGNELMKNHIKVAVRLTPDLPPVLGDPLQLQEAFLNLAMNAMHAMVTAHGQGTLTVTTAFVPTGHPSSGEGDGGGWVEVRIQDEGPGIAPEHRAKIFEPFFTTKPSGQGTGLGLWIVRSTLMTMKGSITYETEIGQGTTFIVRLPVLSENTTGSPSGPNEGQEAPDNRKTEGATGA